MNEREIILGKILIRLPRGNLEGGHAAYVVVMFRVYCHGSRIGLR